MLSLDKSSATVHYCGCFTVELIIIKLTDFTKDALESVTTTNVQALKICLIRTDMFPFIFVSWKHLL